MKITQYSAAAQNLLAISEGHLLGDQAQVNVQHYQQLWHVAQSRGDRAAQRNVRDHVVAVGRLLQGRRSTPQARKLWQELMGLRCSMVMPRMRF